MSTTTNFKRIALVAVAALGMGLLSSAPSQAAIGVNSIVLSTTAGTAVNDQATANQQDSATGALCTDGCTGVQPRDKPVRELVHVLSSKMPLHW